MRSANKNKFPYSDMCNSQTLPERSMTHFAKWIGTNRRFLQDGARCSRNCVTASATGRIRAEPCGCPVRLESPKHHGSGKSRGSSGDEPCKLWLPAGGILLSLFNWGEKEEEKTPELVMTIKRSIWLIQKEDYKKAEQMLHIALRQAQALQHYEGITYVYDVMANLAFEVGDYKKAEVLFVSVMQRLIATGTPKDDIKIVHISLKMAKLFEQMGDLGKAEQGYEFCLKTLQELVAKDSQNENILVLWGMSLDWYARMLLTQSKFVVALKNMEAAYEVCARVYGLEHEQTVLLLNDLGTISCLCGEHDRALNYLANAAKIGEKLPEMDTLGAIHVNMGSVLIKKGLYDEAKKSCEEGRKIAKMRNHEECVVEANTCLDTIDKFLKS